MKDVLIQRLNFTRQELHEVIERLNDDLMPWAPSPGMRTAGGQLIEIASSELQLHQAITGQPMTPWKEILDFTKDFRSLADHLGFLDKVRKDFLATVSQLSNEELAEQTTAVSKWTEGIGLPSISKHDAIVGICQHESYHTGQLVSYLWAKGDDPYKW